jgi:hypothetical protein
LFTPLSTETANNARCRSLRLLDVITLLPSRWPVVPQGNREVLPNDNSGMHSTPASLKTA